MKGISSHRLADLLLTIGDHPIVLADHRKPEDEIVVSKISTYDGTVLIIGEPTVNPLKVYATLRKEP